MKVIHKISFLLLSLNVLLMEAVTVVENGLAPPEIVHTPISTKPRCVVQAQPLDLVFILDSSGSLRNKFQDEIDVIRRIVKHVTIGEKATRVMLVQFSGVQHLEFDFNQFKDREDILSAIDLLRHVSGITRIGGAFEFTLHKLSPDYGMRGPSVPKILYLLSDGRTHDFPKDSEMSDLIRKRIPSIEIWAYGTGEYVAWTALVNITQDPTKIITNQNLTMLESLFDQWHGVEVCEQQPACVRGTDKPLDLALVIDSSESIEKVFMDQIHFSLERIIDRINIHPEAVRLALVTYSGNPFVHFKFNDVKFHNNSIVADYIKTLRPIKGTTSTHLALQTVYDLFFDPDPNSQVREGIPKLVIVITDGRSSHSPHTIASKLREKDIPLISISMSWTPDERELFDIAGIPEHVFTQNNIQNFESVFLNYVGFGCPGIELGSNPSNSTTIVVPNTILLAPRVRGATDISCGPNSVTLTVRTQKPMSGLMYAQQYHNDPRCTNIARGESREISITFIDGTCGLSKTPSAHADGYNYNVTVILQFHPLIVTRADQGLDVTCFHPQPISPHELQRVTTKKLDDTQCFYRLHRFGPNACAALDAKVGESLFHKWNCDSPSNYEFLVHDCFVRSDGKSVQILDSNGCEIDPHFLETPIYSKFKEHEINDKYVYQEMSVFKFPGNDNVVFQCKVSLCDTEGGEKCIKMIPPVCSKNTTITNSLVGPKRHRRAISETNPGFAMTFDLETRTLNVLENEAIRPPQPIQYCDIRY